MDALLEDLYKSLEESSKVYNIDNAEISKGLVEKGKWYKSPELSGGYYSCMKFSHIEYMETSNNRYYYSEIVSKDGTYYPKGTLYRSTNYWSSANFINSILNGPVSKEELSKFLPKDHPDLQ